MLSPSLSTSTASFRPPSQSNTSTPLDQRRSRVPVEIIGLSAFGKTFKKSRTGPTVCPRGSMHGRKMIGL
ncbi:hypothetical protein BC936DRAFT_137007, partial [Jimgerdemannia flammicorona]